MSVSFLEVFCDEVLPVMVEKTMQMCLLPPLATSVYATTRFDMWMSKGPALVMNTLKSKLGAKAYNHQPFQGCRNIETSQSTMALIS